MTSSGLTSPTRADNLSLAASSLNRVRSHSISSDQLSANGYGAMLSPPALVQPQPAFIAISAASQIVTNDHDSHSETWFDQHGLEPSGETAMVNPGALRLVNNFLDQLLFNFLSISKSTSLASLRPAVAETLKPKLAKEAINLADQELEEYLGGGDDEELVSFHNGIEPSGDWDLELVWKRTRLRCMVYSSLGDMEEEDEDHYTELDNLDGPPGCTNRYSNSLGVVSPAVAIFLTSILEYMGEQALTVAGQSAYHRMRSKQQKDERDGTSIPKNVADRVIVDDVDMERVALDRTLGRLWRGWKKRIRSPSASISHSIRRSYSRDSMYSHPQSRRDSLANEQQVPQIDQRYQDPATNDSEYGEKPLDPAESEEADKLYEANIPLPMGDNDVKEIEVPGIAEQSGDEGDDEVEEPKEARRNSMVIFTANTMGLPTPKNSQPTSPTSLSHNSRKRSYSLPSPAIAAFASPSKKRKSTDEDEEPAVEQDNEAKTESHSRKVSQNEEATPAEEPSHEAGNVSRSRSSSHGSHKAAVHAGVAAGGSVVGEAIIAGTEESSHHEQTKIEASDDENDSTEESAEEPQIMTSARISIGDALALDTTRGLSRSSSTARSGSVQSKRSASVHSIRLIDVASPRSPVSRQARVDSPSRPQTARSSESSALSAPPSPNGVAPRGTSPVERSHEKSYSGSSVTKSPSTPNKLVKKGWDAPLPDVTRPRTSDSNSIPRSVPVPDRSPLRGSPQAKFSPTVPSAQDTQFAGKPANSHREEFVLATAPRSRSRSARDDEASSDRATPTNLAPLWTNQIHSPASGTSSAPPLTPLREMMENAPDTSDEASSIAPSYSDASIFQSDIPVGNYSGTGRNETHSRSRTNASDRSFTRSSPPRSHREEDLIPRQDFLKQAGRQGSSSSSIKSYKVRPVRTSEDSTSATEDKGQTFEQLIRSETTLQYTLTPSNMRGIDDVPQSPQTPKLGNFGPRSASKVAALFGKDAPSPNASTRMKPNAPMARDARVANESIGDFADFIRSTGPPKSRDGFAPLPQPTQRLANTSAHRASVPSVPIVVGKPLSSSASRSRLQARDAVVHGDTTSSSELIDFIRQGPPNERSRDNPRIPRTVAPFRSTMDSDQMSTALSNRRLSPLPEDRDPPLSSYSMSSLRTSTTANSSTAIQNKKLAKAPPVKAPTQAFVGFEEEDRMPKRKTRRVKDPYAIDSSDEEDDDEFTVPVNTSNKRVEESIIDFLSSVPPPQNPALRSIFDEPAAPPKKTIMGRFSRSNSVSSSISSSIRNSALPRTSSLPGGPTGPIKKHTPIVPQYSTMPPRPRSNYTTQVTLERKPGARGIQAQKPTPREAIQSRKAPTSDLADFLMNTPPPPSSFEPLPLVVKEEGGFARMFGRRKKVAV